MFRRWGAGWCTGWLYSTLSSICYMDSNYGEACSDPYIPFTCELFDNIQGGAEYCPMMTLYGADNQTLIQCVFDTAVSCPDRAACESMGSCDDSLLSDPMLPSWMPMQPACVVPFTSGDAYGYPNVMQCMADGAIVEWDTGCVYWASTTAAANTSTTAPALQYRRRQYHKHTTAVSTLRDMDTEMVALEDM